MLRSPKLSGLMLVSKSWDLGGGPNFGKASASDKSDKSGQFWRQFWRQLGAAPAVLSVDWGDLGGLPAAPAARRLRQSPPKPKAHPKVILG